MGSLLSRCCGENVHTGWTTKDQADDYKGFSSHLYRVLDVVGVSEEVREGYRDHATTKEILLTVESKVTRDGSRYEYIFGSKYEGTTTKGMNSDTDMLLCDVRRPVVENINNRPADSPALLLISSDTKPGYVKLQSVFNRTKQLISEREVTYKEYINQEGLFLIHFSFDVQNAHIHGPAYTVRAGRSEHDVVGAIRCQTIPSFADEWLHRSRPYQWPSQDQLQRMCSYGCFFVGVGHPESQDKEREWRISFSLQERDLMASLNPTQHKCYVLLKMIKKDIIQPKVGQSLTSYHCKTCIFHLAESLVLERWTPNNILSCILDCLRLLLDWVRQENCPNYFIKDENMFDKLDKPTLTRLSLVLQELLSNGVQFLYEIKCDDLGMLFTLSKSNRRLQKKKLEVKRYRRYKVYIDIMLDLLNARGRLYRFIDIAPLRSERLCRAKHILQYLEQTTVITEHKPRDVRMNLDRLIPYIRFLLVQMKYSNELVQIKVGKDVKKMQALEQEIRLCNQCDRISSRLTAASLYLHCDKLERCQDILQECETRLKPYVTSICQCYNNHTINMMLANKISFEQFRRECTSACIIFLPSEANLAALRYEMYRSVYTPPGSREEYRDYWFDWIVVDSKVYLYFLRYILYGNINKPVYKVKAVDTLLHIIDNKNENLGHRETAFNLLGWIYMQENRVRDAFDCFCRSVSIRSLHNAAKWHMVILLHALIN